MVSVDDIFVSFLGTASVVIVAVVIIMIYAFIDSRKNKDKPDFPGRMVYIDSLEQRNRFRIREN